MLGITELMTDDKFLSWLEIQSGHCLETSDTYSIYCRYRLETA